ncbi:cytosolic protein [Merismopedia glauca]|uniref:Cytosolic protein n=1 Tax=Merismopedia glauca CCAP 1448/3 TaxID=1296344 RepID=A0A2T1C5S7_9CYAN|nr:cytosolic protein [Merismopedia glauca]PSB03483.1 cytosolic protein [Merismopedia glauca CCAP 1448/3]
MTEPRDAFDSPWKDILEAYFQEFVEFFFPQIHAEIDWNRGYDFLDSELQQVVRDAELGKRLADKLVKVWRLSGEETWVLVHIEIQSQEESHFAERMFVYYYRLRDKYDLPIASLAILGDERETWKPKPFQSELWGCEVSFRFPIIKLLDYASDWNQLETSHNPFAIAVMAHLKTKETRNDGISRKEWKFRLTRLLYERGYERQDILNLFRFIDWILELPEELKRSFRDELEQYERERQMPYVTSIERMAEAKGEAKGEARGEERQKQAIALKMLQENIPLDIIARITELTIEQLQQLRSQNS